MHREKTVLVFGNLYFDTGSNRNSGACEGRWKPDALMSADEGSLQIGLKMIDTGPIAQPIDRFGVEE
jgi:hypothetical protein